MASSDPTQQKSDGTPRASLANLFGAGRPAEAPADASAYGVPDTGSLFSETVDIEGSLEGEGDVVLKGRVRGSINVTGALFIAPTGSVQADVAAREVVTAGTVEGNITASERVRVQASGVVQGDIHAPSIIIEDGGGVEGFVQMQPPGGEEDLAEDPPWQAARQAAPTPVGRPQETLAPPLSSATPGVAAPPPDRGLLRPPRGAAARPAESAAAPPPSPSDPLAVFFDEGSESPEPGGPGPHSPFPGGSDETLSDWPGGADH